LIFSTGIIVHFKANSGCLSWRFAAVIDPRGLSTERVTGQFKPCVVSFTKSYCFHCYLISFKKVDLLDFKVSALAMLNLQQAHFTLEYLFVIVLDYANLVEVVTKIAEKHHRLAFNAVVLEELG
jgi:hypothetical protein